MTDTEFTERDGWTICTYVDRRGRHLCTFTGDCPNLATVRHERRPPLHPNHVFVDHTCDEHARFRDDFDHTTSVPINCDATVDRGPDRKHGIADPMPGAWDSVLELVEHEGNRWTHRRAA